MLASKNKQYITLYTYS